jgi:nucleotide-binding universal stress UspA family protein
MFANILIPIAGDSDGWDALEQARTIARTQDSSLTLLYVIQSTAPAYVQRSVGVGFKAQSCSQALAQHRATLEYQGTRMLARMLKRLGYDKAQGMTRVVYTDESVSELILLEAQYMRADLILMGKYDRDGIFRVLEGSVTESVQHLAPCPVMTVRIRDRVIEHLAVGA